MKTSTQESIQSLAENASSKRDFCMSLLSLLAEETKAVNAIAWDCGQSSIRPVGQVQLNGASNIKLGMPENAHRDLLSKASSAAQSMVVHLKQNSHETGPANEPPTLLFVNFRPPNEDFVFELFLPGRFTEPQVQELARNAEAIASAASQLKLSPTSDQSTLSASHSTDSAVTGATAKRISPMQLDEYVHQIHRSLDPKETALQIANEARRILDCDRVSVVEVRGSQYKIIAISGQPSVNQRSNTVYLLRQLVRRVLPTRKTFWYPADNSLPKEIEKPLGQYLAIAATRSLIVCPIFDQPPPIDDRADPIPVKQKLIGGLIIERSGEEWTQDSVSQAVEVVSRHASDSFRNAHNHRQLLFYPLWKWLGKSRVLLAARNLPKTLLAAATLALVTMFLIFWPAELKVSCEGILVPENKSNVFVPVDGTVAEILVSHGSAVQKGQTLIRLENLELETRAAELEGKIQEANQNIKTTETLLLASTDDDEQLGEQTLNAQKEELKSLKRQLSLTSKKLEKLNISSPRNGQVVTWNIKDKFRQRPVTRGERLMEIVDVEGSWMLDLNLTDSKAGHVLEAWKTNGGQLTVEFILAADPEKQFKGQVLSIGRATEISGDQQQVIPLKVEIDKNDLDSRQAKSGVFANIVCKKTSLGYSLFHGVGEFFQKQWFKLF